MVGCVEIFVNQLQKYCLITQSLACTILSTEFYSALNLFNCKSPSFAFAKYYIFYTLKLKEFYLQNFQSII